MGWTGQMDTQGHTEVAEDLFREQWEWDVPRASGAFWAQGLEKAWMWEQWDEASRTGCHPTAPQAGAGMFIMDSGCSSLILVSVFFPSPSVIAPNSFQKKKLK